MPQADMSLRGKHNIYNSLAAGLACNIVGIDHETLHKGLSDFPGVEHRLEKVGKFQGVYYVNDSKATNVDLQGTDDHHIENFRDYLTNHGVFTTIRASRGQDIFAAC